MSVGAVFEPFSVEISHESAYGDIFVTVKNSSGRTFTAEFQKEESLDPSKKSLGDYLCKIVFNDKFFFVSYKKGDAVQVGSSEAFLIHKDRKISIIYDGFDDSKNRSPHLFFSEA